MKTCVFCGVAKPLDNYTMRKKPPIQPYAACKDCEGVAYGKDRKVAIQQEFKELREKAISLRKFTPEQDRAIYLRVQKGETRKAIAKELGVNQNTVGSAYKRGALDKG